MKIKLKKPVTYKEQEYQEIDLDLENLTGVDLMKANVALRGSEDKLLPMFSMVYQVEVAALAAKVPTDVIRALGAQDFMRVTVEVQAFLLDKG
jgi:hypothetical protein